MPCYLCNQPRDTYFGHFCKDCNNLKHLMSLYSPGTIHELVTKCLLVNEDKIESRVNKNLSEVIKKKDISPIEKK